MQVAANPFSGSLSHSHYHSYYQLHPPGPHDHALKRQYLALLPPQQIIDICLQFDTHVPPYVKNSIWPSDINAAIAGLQKVPPKPAEELLQEAATTSKAAVPAMDSLKSPEETSLSIQDSLPPTEPQPPDKPESSTDTVPPPGSSSTTTPSSPQPAQATTSSTTQHPYPYSYTHSQAAYPHTPYYPPHPAYSYPYGPYPVPMQNAYHPQPPPPTTAYPPQPSMFNNVVTMHQPPQHDNVGGDDLPSYEEMLVEALTDCSDPEGCAPKDLFLWMAARYPLQSNFRPSASQALQKAYKRGRFEKGSNGKYRLNASYNGSNAIRRTTRRPQTHNAQSTPGNATPAAPPFTRVPRVHHDGHSSAQQPYLSASYSLPYPGYPAHPAASTATAPGAPANTQPTTQPKPAPGTPTTTDPDTAAAYEAAQNILSAINFGELYQLAPEERADGATKDITAQQVTSQASATDNGVEKLLSHVQAMLANANTESNNHNNPPLQHPPPAGGSGGGFGPVPTTVAQSQSNLDTGADPRAELQAQLALLAAQLADLAKTEVPVLLPQHPQPRVAFATSAPPALPTLSYPPPPIAPALPPIVAAVTTTTPVHAPISVVPVSAVPKGSHEVREPEPLMEGEVDGSDDDDMEEII